MVSHETFLKIPLASSRARFIAFTAFLICVFFMGGGSRGDIQSLLILRPLAFCMMAYSLTIAGGAKWDKHYFPLALISALAVVMALQLIPLPPSIWTTLPERQVFAEIGALVGIEQAWRPLTLSPSATLNSLFSLSVPAAAMMLYLNLDQKDQRKAKLVLILLLLLSAIWGMLQIMGSSRGPLYLYRITNFSLPVGLFSNRNHQAVILAFLIALIGWYIGSEKRKSKRFLFTYNSMCAAILVLVPMIFLIGSRAGLILMAPAIFAALFFIIMGANSSWMLSRSENSRQKNGSRRQWMMLAGLLAGAVTVSALSIYFSRSLAFERLFAVDAISGLRVQLLPTLFSMLKDFWVLGSGFGSFEHVYKVYEPLDLLKPTYLNNAHNDFMQFMIEGGIPAILLVIILLSWIIRRLVALLRTGKLRTSVRNELLLCLFFFGTMAAASVGDYPLRVPIIMTLSGIIMCMFSDLTSGHASILPSTGRKTKG